MKITVGKVGDHWGVFVNGELKKVCLTRQLAREVAIDVRFETAREKESANEYGSRPESD